MAVNSTSEFILPNSMRVLMHEMHNAPVVGFSVWYRVGSRNEHTGNTGAAHWIEHMTYKGTTSLGKGELIRRVTRNGGQFNGMTWNDFTTYYEVLPSDRIDIALEIESERMANALFNPEEVSAERSVIISEREGAENDPHFWLFEEVISTVFKIHPYHHDTIGWKVDLETMTRDDLYDFYKTFYVPNNAFVVVVGDFQTQEMLEQISRHFGTIPRGKEVPVVQAVEPPQQGERRVIVRRPGPAAYLDIAFRAPSASDPDFFPLFFLTSILSGVGSMTFSGHGSPGRSSRLYRKLVETELATDVGCSYLMTLDPFIVDAGATLRPGVKIEKVEAVLLGELDRISSNYVTKEEMRSVLKQTKAQFVYANEGVINRMLWLGMLDIASTHKVYDQFVTNLERVTKEDIRRVAEKYLVETNRTVGWFVPTDGAGKRAPKASAKKRARK